MVPARFPAFRIHSDAAGYRSLANFNRQFRAARGMTPRAFRRSFAERTPHRPRRMG